MKEKIGTVTHFYDKISVAIVKLDMPLKVGAGVVIKGNKTEYRAVIEEIQLDHNRIEEGKKGQEVGIKLDGKVREGDEVYSDE